MALIRKSLIGLIAFFLCYAIPLPCWGLVASSPIIAINQHGRPLAGGTVSVVNTSTLVDVTSTLYADSAGTVSYSATVPQSGIVQFFGSAGSYQVTVSSQGVTRVYYIDIPTAVTGVADGDFPSSKLPGHLIATSSGVYSALKHNLNASSSPTTGDDSGDNYDVGSIWIDTTNDAAYVCVDNTLSNAVWVQAAAGSVTAGSNVGSGSKVFKQLSSTTLQFRTLVADDGVTITENTNDITIGGPTINLGTTGTDANISVLGAVYTLNLPSASGSARGFVTTGTQAFAGDKTALGAWIFDGQTSFTNNVSLGDTSADTITVSGTMSVATALSLQSVSVAGQIEVVGATTLDGNVTLGDAAGDTITVTGTSTFAEDITASSDVDVTGEVSIGGVTGSGKAVCVKADGDLGVCSDAVGGSGTCTCG